MPINNPAYIASLCAACSTVPRVRLLAALADRTEATRKQIAEAIGETPEAMGYSIKVLLAATLVEETRVESGPSFVERYYRLTDDGRALHQMLAAICSRAEADVVSAA